MLTYGFAPSYGDVVTQGVPFTCAVLTLYIVCLNVTGAGNIVWINNQGQAQYSDSVPVGWANIGATQIVASATVNGVSRTTTATISSWLGVQLNNIP